MLTINQTVNKFTVYYGCPSSLSWVVRSLEHDFAPMSNRIRTFHGNAVASEYNFWDLSTLEYDSTSLLRNVGVRQPSDVGSKRIESSTTTLLKLVSGNKTPPVSTLRYMSQIQALTTSLKVIKMPLCSSLEKLSDCICVPAEICT
jgi:hypothetical protein